MESRKFDPNNKVVSSKDDVYIFIKGCRDVFRTLTISKIKLFTKKSILEVRLSNDGFFCTKAQPRVFIKKFSYFTVSKWTKEEHFETVLPLENKNTRSQVNFHDSYKKGMYKTGYLNTDLSLKKRRKSQWRVDSLRKSLWYSLTIHCGFRNILVGDTRFCKKASFFLICEQKKWYANILKAGKDISMKLSRNFTLTT